MNNKINNSELFILANRIRKESGISQKEAFAQARQQLESKPAVENTTKKRGCYIRTEEWKARRSEQMKAYWANPNKTRVTVVRSDEWKARHSEQMKAYWANRKEQEANA